MFVTKASSYDILLGLDVIRYYKMGLDFINCSYPMYSPMLSKVVNVSIIPKPGTTAAPPLGISILDFINW